MARSKDPSAEYEQLMGRPFGRIYKPRYASRETCTGQVETRPDGSWACQECGACAARRKQADATHRRMIESPFWAFSYSHNGQRHNVSVRSRDHADAVRVKREILKEILTGRFPWMGREEPTLASLLDMVRVHYKTQGNKSTRALELGIKNLEAFPGFDKGALKAAKITEARVEEYKAWRKERRGRKGASDTVSNGTINRELAYLRQALKMALSRIDESGQPMLARMPKIRFLRESPPRQGFFEDDQFDAVYKELLRGPAVSGPEDLADLALFYFLTGWRSTEPRALQWRNVNWFAKTITLPAELNKGREARIFPFGPFAKFEELLKKRRKTTDRFEAFTGKKIPWLFHRWGRPIKTFRRAWLAACARAGVSGRTPHDFRRTAARNIYMATGDLVAACNLVGWESIAMAKRYKIDTLKDREEAVRKLAAWTVEHEKAREAARQMSLGFGGGGGKAGA